MNWIRKVTNFAKYLLNHMIMCTFTNYFCNQKCSKEDMTIFPSCIAVKLNYQMAESQCDLFESVATEVT